MLTSEVYLRFIAYRTEMHVSPATLRFYAGRLKTFVERFAARDFAGLKRLEIMEWLAAAGQGLSDSTKRHNVVAFNTLHKFALEQGIIEQPLIKEKIPKPPMGQRDRLPTEAETAALLQHAHPAFVRIYTALRQSGARPGELCRSRIADLNRQAGVITLAQHKTAKKTGKPRRIPVGQKLLALLDAAIAGRTEGPLFLSPSGKGWQVENLSRTYTRLRKAAGLPQGLVLYLARHECGSKVCKEKGLEAARRILGHTNPKTTTRYIHYDDRELADIQDVMDAGGELGTGGEDGRSKMEDRKGNESLGSL